MQLRPCSIPTALLVLLALTHDAAARELKPRKRDDEKKAVVDGTDRFGHLRMKPALTYAATGAVTVSATALQLMTPSWVRSTFGAACSGGAGALLLKVVTWMDDLKTTNPLALTMGHGLLLKAVAEVLSQLIPQRGAVVWLDPLRLVRSTVASLLSSSLTFYYWTRSSLLRGLAAPGWLRALLGQGLGTSVTKMVVTQLVYRPVNVFLFLVAQAFFRGDSVRQIVHVITSKFKGGLVGGIVFFAISNMIMFSIPAPFLHPIIGAIAGLIFNVWLAMVAYQKPPDASPSTPEPAAPDEALSTTSLSTTSLSTSLAELSTSVSSFPATAALLGSVATLETLAAAALYTNRRPRPMATTTTTTKMPSVAARGSSASVIDLDDGYSTVTATPRTVDTVSPAMTRPTTI